MPNTTQPKPVLDLKAIFNKLGPNDKLIGYDLYLGTTHVPLQEVEKAYLKADQAGMDTGNLVQFNDGSGELGVVIGRNVHVLDPARPAAKMPVKVHSSRGGVSVYSLSELQRVPLGLEVYGLTTTEGSFSGEIVGGPLTEATVGVDAEGASLVTVVIGGTTYNVRDFATLCLFSQL